MTVNDKRAHEGLIALNAYRYVSKEADMGESCNLHALSALLSSLRHLCDAWGVNFDHFSDISQDMHKGDVDGNDRATDTLLPADSETKIVIEVHGGLASVTECSNGVYYEIRDYDIEGMDESELIEDENGNQYYPS